MHRIIANSINLIAIILLATFPGWHEEADPRTGSDVDVKPFPSRPVSQAALACTIIAAGIHLTAMIWQHVGAVSSTSVVKAFLGAAVDVKVGTTCMVLGWLACVLCGTAFIGLLFMILSIHALDQLTDEDD